VRTGRLTDEVPDRGEDFHVLAELPGAIVEHIVSSDCADHRRQVQEWDEWVVVVCGAAELEIDGQRLVLAARDWVLIPAGTPHRVVCTRAGSHWIAVHARSQDSRD
jgi:cupin 2 domain-containing protein